MIFLNVQIWFIEQKTLKLTWFSYSATKNQNDKINEFELNTSSNIKLFLLSDTTAEVQWYYQGVINSNISFCGNRGNSTESILW